MNNSFNNKLIIQQFKVVVNGEKMKSKQKIFIAFILNLFFSIFELVGGFLTGSVAILSDALHDFGDATSIGISYFLEKLSGKKPNETYTYGYLRFSVLGGLITSVTLLISSVIVIYSAVLKIINPTVINHDGMLIFAIVGLTVNLVATFFTHGGHTLNQKAVNLHMLEDALGWFAVLVGAIIIKFTALYIIDPILSIIVATFIVINAVKNLITIFNLFLLKTPKNVPITEILEHLKSIDGVIDVHHFHLSSLDGSVYIATLHLVTEKYDSIVKRAVKNELKEHGITHSTIEIEEKEESCQETNCNVLSEVSFSHSHCHHAHSHTHCSHSHNENHAHENLHNERH